MRKYENVQDFSHVATGKKKNSDFEKIEIFRFWNFENFGHQKKIFFLISIEKIFFGEISIWKIFEHSFMTKSSFYISKLHFVGRHLTEHYMSILLTWLNITCPLYSLDWTLRVTLLNIYNVADWTLHVHFTHLTEHYKSPDFQHASMRVRWRLFVMRFSRKLWRRVVMLLSEVRKQHFVIG